MPQEKVLHRLEQFGPKLHTYGLANLEPFNDAYIIVTRTINTAMADGIFANPRLLEAFVVEFAEYYFEVVDALISKPSSAPAPWRLLAEAHAAQPSFVLVLLGANAHINYDLPFALKAVMVKGSGSSLLRDLRAVDRLLARSGREIITSLELPSGFTGAMLRKTRWLYFRPVMQMVFIWRIRAWRSYRAMSKNPEAIKNVDRRSCRIAHRLLRFGPGGIADR